MLSKNQQKRPFNPVTSIGRKPFAVSVDFFLFSLKFKNLIAQQKYLWNIETEELN